jgi:uncharacterized protein (TIGR02452 family)
MDKRTYRINVLDDTIKKFTDKNYTSESGKQVLINSDDLVNSVMNTRLCELKKFKDIPPNPVSKSNLYIVNEDCLETALVMKRKGYSPLVLNMASFKHPGGGYKTGAGAQEESIFRRTNLFQCLDNSNSQKLYPLKATQAIYTKGSVVIKNSEELKYKLLDNPEKLDFIACAAHRCSPNDLYIDAKTKHLKMNESVYNATWNKLDLVFKTGIDEKNNVLILGAFGCGAYHNPPYEIAKLLKEFIDYYAGYFEYIILPIIDDKNAFNNNKAGNLVIFSKVFEADYIMLSDLDKVIKAI